jgi:hypothetical protein
VEQTAFVSSSNPEARHALINIVKQKKDVERERERERDYKDGNLEKAELSDRVEMKRAPTPCRVCCEEEESSVLLLVNMLSRGMEKWHRWGTQPQAPHAQRDG